MLTIRHLDRADTANALRWDEFVFACPEASFFHRSAWQEIISRVFRHSAYFLYADSSAGIRGVLPLAHVNSRLFGNALVALPFAVYGGIASIDAEATMELEKAAQELARRLGVDHLEFRNVAPRHADWPMQDLYVTFRKRLLPEVEGRPGLGFRAAGFAPQRSHSPPVPPPRAA